MRTILAALLIGLASPALADDCAYLNEAGDSLEFVDDGENTVTIALAAGDQLVCSWAVTPDGPEVQDIVCADGPAGGFWFAPAKRGDISQDLLIFLDEVWYRECR